MSQRLFFAVVVPNDARKKIESELYPKLKKVEPKLKLVPSQNLHITLLFLGECPEEKTAELKKRFNELQREKAFEIRLEKTGSFNERVLWIGIENGKKELESLFEILSRETGWKPEPFSAHLTIARNKSLSKEDWKRMLEKLSKKKFGAVFQAKAVHLMESVLKPSGSEYKSVFEWKLLPP